MKSIKRDKNVEATIHRDFQYVLSVSEKKMNDRIYAMTEEMRDLFPSPNADAESDKAKKLDLILSKNPWAAHALLFDADKGLLFRSQPQQLGDSYIREEHDRLNDLFTGGFGMEGKMMLEGMHKKPRAFSCYQERVKRACGYGFMTTAFFTFPQLSSNRVVFGGVSFDPDYLKQNFFPEMFEELVAQKMTEDHRDRLAMAIYPADFDGDHTDNLLASSTGWGEGRAEVTRNLKDVFRGLALGIKFQGTSADAIANRWVQQSLLILGVLSLLMIGGLVLTYRSVSKEMDLARLNRESGFLVVQSPMRLVRQHNQVCPTKGVTSRTKSA